MAVPAAAGDAVDVAVVLKSVETRYNRAASLQLNFSESYTFQNRRRPAEWGQVFLKKPGKMRWNYQKPAGKLFVSDGKDVYYYNPAANRAEKLKLKEAEDMRAPLAFLLGKLDFQRDFSRFTARRESSFVWITCEPRNGKAPYREVSFKTSGGGRIDYLRVVGQDHSILDFEFAEEKLNPAIADGLFLFQLPKGVEFIDLSAEKPDH